MDIILVDTCIIACIVDGANNAFYEYPLIRKIDVMSWRYKNLGHEDFLTTLCSYGEVQQHRQGEIFQQLKIPRSSANQHVDDIARAVVKAMADQNSQIGA